MSRKVKRGLGLLVVAVIAALVVLVLLRVPAEGLAAPFVAIGLLAGVAAFFVGVFGGLGMLAWGLLRD